jgi:hypothetical protein
MLWMLRGQQAESAMMMPEPEFGLAIGLAPAVLIVYWHWHVEGMRSREIARGEQTNGRAVNVHVLDVM